MAEIDDFIEKTGEIDYETTDQAFAAYLATKFMFLEAIDTGKPQGKGKYGTKKAFVFLVPKDEDMDQHWFDFDMGTDASVVPAKVMFNKLRLMRQACQRPFNQVETGKVA